MRTRKSNKTKSFKVQTYDFEAELSDDNDTPQDEPRQPFADRALKDDGDFDVAGADQEAESPDDEIDPAVSPSSSSAEEPENEPAFEELQVRNHERRRPTKGQAGSMKYFGIDKESIPGKHHVPLGYAGLPDRHIRGVTLAQHWYGPKRETQKIALELLDRWLTAPLLPFREEPRAVKKGAWDEDVYEREAEYADAWLERAKTGSTQMLKPLSRDEAARWDLQAGPLPTFTGTYSQQPEWKGYTFDSTVISNNGIPCDADQDESKESTGWLIDTGGLVVDMDWATRRKAEAPQWLALAIIPHSDQEVYDYGQEAGNPGFQKTGAVQIWEFEGTNGENDTMRTASIVPHAKKLLCFDIGRSRRVAWSTACEHLAIICANGKVYVVDPKMEEPGFRVKVDKPLALLALEDGIEAMSLSWVTFNRLAIGYSDGSIALWSIFPASILSRHAIHHSAIVSIASGYPTKPYSIASTPIGGQMKLIDLRNPSCETTELMNLAINTQPGLLQWSDHLKGFCSLTASSAIVNTTVGFTYHDFFPIMRRISSLESRVTCMSIGKTHPFLLVGGLDGTLTAMNPQFEIFQLRSSNRYERSEKLKIFQHEHQPPERFPSDSPARLRGASRIIHGFKPEKNHHVSMKSRKVVKSKSKSKKKKKDDDGFVDDDEEEDEGGKGVVEIKEPKRGVVYEPLTRVTAVKWNPNEGYGTWAAAALGSGLVKIMDLGLEQV